MRSSSSPCMILSCPILTPPCMTGKIFLPHPRPLGPHEASLHHVKLHFLLICLTTITILLIKSVLLIKIYLKLQLNLSYQIKVFFTKTK